MPPTHDRKIKSLTPPQKVTQPPLATIESPQTAPQTLIQRALRQIGSLTPRDVQTLQRTIGNRAVGAMIQRVSGAARRKIAKMDFTSVDEVQDWQTAGGLTDKDIDKILTLEPEKLAKALALTAGFFKGAATFADGIDEMFEQAKVKAINSKKQAEAAAAPVTPPKPAILIALNDRGIGDDDAKPFITRVGAGAITPWLAATADDTIVRRTIIASNRYNKTLVELDALLITANVHGYVVSELLDLLLFHSYGLVLSALTATAAENRLTYVQLWLSYGVTAASQVQLKRLVRFQARLRDGAAPTFTVYKKDKNYAKSDDPPSRTGFLRYNFGGEIMEVHTHWNTAKKQIVSMHVQDNSSNGLEMNQWKWFADVAAVVVAGQNSGAGVRAPTTNPPGGTLTL